MKKLFALVMCLTLVFAMASCGGKTENTVNSTVSTSAEKGSEAPKAEAVDIGNTITVDFAEITIDEAGIADDIKTSIKTGNITYTSGPDSSEDTEFVYIRGTIKNTSKAEMNNPLISGNVDADGYTYELDLNVIESDGSSAFSIAPLISYTYTLYAEVPNEIAQNFEKCSMNFGFEENFENVFTSDESYDTQYIYTIKITK